MQKACAQPSKVTKHSMVSQVVPQHSNISTEEVEGGDDSEQLTPGEEAYLSSALHSELAEHLDQFDELPVMLPPSMLNYNMPWRKSLDSSEPEADNFIRDSDPQKQRFDKQVCAIYLCFLSSSSILNPCTCKRVIVLALASFRGKGKRAVCSA